MLKTILLVVLFWLLPQAYSYSEETSNLVNPADEWTQSGKVSTTQCSYSGTLEDGEVCTGSANTRGVADGGGPASVNPDNNSILILISSIPLPHLKHRVQVSSLHQL